MSRFEMQRDAHRLIRNDDDYDDWEYGAEPLPGETWLQLGKSGPSSPALPTEATRGTTSHSLDYKQPTATPPPAPSAATVRPLSCESNSILTKSNDLSTAQE